MPGRSRSKLEQGVCYTKCLDLHHICGGKGSKETKEGKSSKGYVILGFRVTTPSVETRGEMGVGQGGATSML